MAAATNAIRDPLEEGSDYVYAPTDPLLYSDGTPVIEGHVSTFTLTLVDVVSGTIIRNSAAVLTTLGGDITSSGYLTVPITEVDTAGVGSTRFQQRRMTFELLTNAGINKNWVVLFTIDNFADV